MFCDDLLIFHCMKEKGFRKFKPLNKNQGKLVSILSESAYSTLNISKLEFIPTTDISK